jgi:hypothetical protein
MQSASCSNPTTPDQVLDCANNRFSVTVTQGAVVGAVLGGVAGYFLGGRSVGGAALGVAAGGALGAAAGYAVARNNFQQQRTESNLGALIDSARADATIAQQAAAAARQRAAEAQTKVRMLLAQFRSGGISADRYQAELTTYRETADRTARMIANCQRRAGEIRSDANSVSGPGRAQLNSQAQALDAATRDLTQSRNLLLQAVAGA